MSERADRICRLVLVEGFDPAPSDVRTLLADIADLTAQLALAKKELEYAETTPASEVAKEVCALRDTNAALGLKVNERDAQLAAMRELVDRQAEDEALWFRAKTAPEAYLQQELRKLHALIESPH